jgi:LysR family transcriptional regulator, glycine cleavage system transcriptional activator
MTRSIPLGALRVFESAARLGSFKLAAAELSVTPGAVSRQIATLESRLKRPLFERHNREVKLTAAGRGYFREIGPALACIELASQRLAQQPARRTVRVDATPTFALHWLIPRLPNFNATHPGVDVELSTSVGPLDRTLRFDWIVRRDPDHFRGLKGVAFLAEHARLVASPSLKGIRRLKRPAHLARHRLIAIKARTDLWPTWFAAQSLDDEHFVDRIELDQTIFAIQAALEGLGVAVLPELFVANLLKAGSLVCPLGEAPVVTGAYHLVTLKRQPSGPAEAFREWIQRAH